MRDDIQQHLFGRQVRSLVTIPTLLPRITTSLPKIKNERRNKNILARARARNHKNFKFQICLKDQNQ